MHDDRHPDHHTAHFLAREANYLAGLSKIESDADPWRTPRVYYYHPYTEETMPAMLVDVSDHFERKCASLRAHASQFFNPDYEGRKTHISSPEFWESITTRAAYWGSRAGVKYAEALYAPGPVVCDLPPLG
jgi:LmbE family N-acetylglucosaminyl deacetylase